MLKIIPYLLAVIAISVSQPAFSCSKEVVKQSQDLIRAFSKENTKYYIREDIDLGNNTVKIGKGSTLIFEGGSLSNGTIVGNDTRIVADDYEIFKRGYTRYHAYKKPEASENSQPHMIRQYHNSVVLDGTWNNKKCGTNWTGLLNDSDEDVMLSLRNFILLHKLGVKVSIPSLQALGYESTRIPGNHQIDFNNSSIDYPDDLSSWEDKTIPLPKGAISVSLESGYGLFSMESNTAIKNLNVDAKSQFRQDEEVRFGVSCIISVGSAVNVIFDNTTIANVLGPGVTAQSGSKDLSFSRCTFRNIGEHIVYSHQYKGYCHFTECTFDTWDSERISLHRQGMDYVYKHTPPIDVASYDELYAFDLQFTDCTFINPKRVNKQGHTLGGFVTGDFPAVIQVNNCKFIGAMPVLNPGGGSTISEKSRKAWKMIVKECDGAPTIYPSKSNYNILAEYYDCVNIPFRTVYARRYERCTMFLDLYEDNLENVSSSFTNEFSKPLIVKDCNLVDRNEQTVINHPSVHRPVEFLNCFFTGGETRVKKYELINVKGEQAKRIIYKNCIIDNQSLLYDNYSH